MNYTFDTTTNIKSRFISEDYFPAIVQFSPEELNNHFIEYSYNDTDMFELVVDSENGIIKQFTLTLCNHFKEQDINMSIPDAKEGSIYFNDTTDVQCDLFVLSIYKDGLHISISDKSAYTFLKCGQLIFALDDTDSLISLYITNLSSDDISHVLREVHYTDN